MSAETYEDLLFAIEAHVLDELDGQMMVIKDWVLVGAVSDLKSMSDRESIFLHRSPNTPLYGVSGLLDWGKSAMFPEDFSE